MLRNDPADDEVERVARILCVEAGLDPEDLDPDGDPLWRRYVRMAVSAIAAHLTLTSR